MATDQAFIGKILIAFVAGAMVSAIGAAALWPEADATKAPTPPSPSRVAAAEPAPRANPADAIGSPDNCRAISVYARSIMESRQRGVAMADVMDLAVEADPHLSPMLRQMTVDAYALPRMRTEGNQARSARDFENEAYLFCSKMAADPIVR